MGLRNSRDSRHRTYEINPGLEEQEEMGILDKKNIRLVFNLGIFYR